MGGGDNAITVNASIDAEGFEKGTKRIEEAVNSLGKTVTGVFSEIKQFIGSLDFDKIGKALRSGDFKEFGEQIRNAMQEAAEAAQSMDDTAAPDLGSDEPIKQKSKAFEALRSAAQKAGSAIKSIAGTIGEVAHGAVNGARGIIKTFSGIVSGARNTSRGINQGAQLATGGIRKLTSLLLGVGSAYSIISKAVNAFMSENQALSAKMGSIWTALGNLLGPIITQVISWITTAISYFIEFLRLLGITAKTASQASKSAKGAGSELKKTIAGFDELNILQEGGGGGGGGGGLEDKEPPDWIKDIAELLKEHQWAKAGQVLADKLNEMVASVDWEGLGKKIGFYLNGALEFLDAAIEGFHWDELGKDLAEFVNNLFGELNGEAIGRLLVAPFAKGLTLLTNFLANLNAEELAELITSVIVSALNSVKNSLTEAPFYEIGEKIREFFSKIKWEDIRDAIFDVLEAAWNGAVALLEGILGFGQGEATPEKVGAKIRELFENIKWGEVAAAIFTALRKAWQLGVGLFKGLLGIGDGDASPSELGTKISGFFAGLNWDSVKSAISTALETAWNGALEFFKGLLTTDGEDIPLAASLKTLLDSIGEFASAISTNWDEKIKPVLEWTVNEALPGFFSTLADTIGDLAKLLNGEMNFGEFIGNMNGLELALAGLFAIKIGSWGLDVATGIKGIFDLFSGKGASVTIKGLEDLASAAGKVTTEYTTVGNLVPAALGEFGGAATLATAGLGGLLAALGLVPFIMLDSKLSADFLADGLESAGDSAEDLAAKISEWNEMASHQEDFLWDASGATDAYGYSLQEAGYAATAAAEALPVLAEMLGITTDELNAQIEAAGGDVTQIAALTGAVNDLSEGHKNLNQEMVDHLVKLAEEGTLTETYLYKLIQQGQITAEYVDLLKDMGYVIGENGEVVKDVTKAVEGQADALQAGAQATNDAAAAADALAENLDNTPSSAEAAGEAVLDVGTNTEAGTNKAEAEVADYSKTVSDEFDGLVDTVTKDSEAMKEAVSDTWTDVSPEMLASISEMVEVIKQFVTENGSSIHEFAENIKKEIVDNTTAMATTFSEKFKAMGKDVSDFTSSAQTKIEDSTQAMDQAYTEKFDSMELTTSDFVTNAEEQIDSFAMKAVKDMDDLVKAMKAVWDNAKPTIQSSLSGISSAVNWSFTILRAQAYVWGADLIINLNNGIVAAWNTLVPTIAAVAAMIRSYLGFSEPEKGPLSDFHTYAPDMIDLFAKGIKDNMGKVESAASDLAGGISDAIQNGNYSAAGEASSEAVDSIVDQLNDGKDDVSASAKGLANEIGKVFSGYGIGIGEQIETSITESRPRLIASAKDLATGISGAIHSGDYKIDIAGRFDYSMDGFANKIVDGFADMVSRLQEIADNVVFSMPVVAGGGFLPYGVNEDPFGLNPAGGGEAELIQAVDELRGLIEDFRYAVDHMQWVAQFDDFRAIAKRVTKIQKQEERARG